MPKAAPGCKRIIVDPGYLEALHKPNVSLSWDAIKGVVEEGIELKSGKVLPFDVIVFSTGYSLPVLAGKAKSFEVKEEATDKYNTWLQNRLARSVWTDCNSYYQAGGQKQTKIIATFPGPVALFWWLTLWPKWNEFVGVGAEAWGAEQRREIVRRRVLLAGLVAVAAGLGVWLQGKPVVDLVKKILSLVVV
ncbi:hypothetical protein C0993_011645 [Termitomyces sp. T159_Od127]|nr:hypothetical protein C0993_011645 [Termitomyces sp. T159_Od127]